MQLKNEENVKNEYVQEDVGAINNRPENSTNNSKPKKSLKKWRIVGATLAVAGIVSVGIVYKIYKESEPLGGAVQTLDSFEVTLYNQNFLPYCGINKSRMVAMQLLDRIMQYNNSNERFIKVAFIYEPQNMSGDIDYTKAHSTQIRSDAIIIKSNNDDLVKKISYAKNARFNIYYHTDVEGYIDSIEFYQVSGVEYK